MNCHTFSSKKKELNWNRNYQNSSISIEEKRPCVFVVFLFPLDFSLPLSSFVLYMHVTYQCLHDGFENQKNGILVFVKGFPSFFLLVCVFAESIAQLLFCEGVYVSVRYVRLGMFFSRVKDDCIARWDGEFNVYF